MTQEQAKGVAYLSEEQLVLLQNLPEHVKLIMLGCDTEFFQNKKEALAILGKLCTYGKDISVITKIPLSDEYVEMLSGINKKMKENGNIFSFSISLPCTSNEMQAKYEPKVPSPSRRIETLAKVSERGIPTTVAIRPLLPDVSDNELEEIIARTSAYCFGYYSGPLYLQEQKVKLLLPEYNRPETETQPHWMLKGNKYQAIERDGQMDFLKAIIKKHDRLLFDGAADAIDHLRKKNLYEKSGN